MLTPDETKTLSAGWSHLKTKPVFVVVAFYTDYEPFYVEPPEVHAEECEEPDEALLRVFMTVEEAQRYIDTIHSYDDQDLPLVLLEMKMEELLERVKEARESIEHAFEAPLRIDLCSMPEGCHPQYVDTIFSDLVTLH